MPTSPWWTRTPHALSPGGGGQQQCAREYHDALSAAGFALTDVTFDTGYILSGALGYKWDSGLRTELELSTRKSNINDCAGAGTTGG